MTTAANNNTAAATKPEAEMNDAEFTAEIKRLNAIYEVNNELAEKAVDAILAAMDGYVIKDVKEIVGQTFIRVRVIGHGWEVSASVLSNHVHVYAPESWGYGRTCAYTEAIATAIFCDGVIEHDDDPTPTDDDKADREGEDGARHFEQEQDDREPTDDEIAAYERMIDRIKRNAPKTDAKDAVERMKKAIKHNESVGRAFAERGNQDRAQEVVRWNVWLRKQIKELETEGEIVAPAPKNAAPIIIAAVIPEDKAEAEEPVERKKTYWHDNGEYQELADELEKLIPVSGEVENADENPKLERFRKVGNAYHDLFNNGGGNPCRGTAKYFPGTISLASVSEWDKVYEITEPIMSRAILKAAKEQGITLDPKPTDDKPKAEAKKLDLSKGSIYYNAPVGPDGRESLTDDPEDDGEFDKCFNCDNPSDGITGFCEACNFPGQENETADWVCSVCKKEYQNAATAHVDNAGRPYCDDCATAEKIAGTDYDAPRTSEGWQIIVDDAIAEQAMAEFAAAGAANASDYAKTIKAERLNNARFIADTVKAAFAAWKEANAPKPAEPAKVAENAPAMDDKAEKSTIDHIDQDPELKSYGAVSMLHEIVYALTTKHYSPGLSKPPTSAPGLDVYASVCRLIKQVHGYECTISDVDEAFVRFQS